MSFEAKILTQNNADVGTIPNGSIEEVKLSSGVTAKLNSNTGTIADGSIAEVKLTQDLKDKVNAGSGDMTKAVFDPNNRVGDVFNTDNHTDGTTNKVFLATERIKLDGIDTGAKVDQDLSPYATKTGAETLANKRITNRIQSIVSSATVTANSDNDDLVIVTAQSVGLTLANPSGTPAQGQQIIFRIKDNGTARAITYGTQFRAIGEALATTTTNKTLYIGAVYNSTDSKWDTFPYLEIL